VHEAVRESAEKSTSKYPTRPTHGRGNHAEGIRLRGIIHRGRGSGRSDGGGDAQSKLVHPGAGESHAARAARNDVLQGEYFQRG